MAPLELPHPTVKPEPGGAASDVPTVHGPDADRACHAAFEALYREHRPAVWRYARRRTPDEHAAADVVADTFAVAWRRWDTVPAAADQRLPWLYAVARRVAADDTRGARRRSALKERVTRSSRRTQHDDHGPAYAEREVVLQALARLSKKDQELLMLISWEGLEPAEASKVLGCRPATVHVRLHRARHRLAHALSELGAAIDDATIGRSDER